MNIANMIDYTILGSDAKKEKIITLCQEAAEVKIKAAGGIRTEEDARKMIEAGVDRLGTSGGINIVGAIKGC